MPRGARASIWPLRTRTSKHGWYRWPAVDDMPVFERESRVMPRTDNGVAFEFSFRQWSAKMRTFFGHDEDAAAAFQEHNGNFFHGSFVKFVLRQVGFAHDGNEFFRQFFGCVVHADPFVVNEVAAKPRADGHANVTTETAGEAGAPATIPALPPGGEVDAVAVRFTRACMVPTRRGFS